MKECDFIVIGGGIAGASTAYQLADEGRVALLEKEEQPGYHTTGRSLAVHTVTYGPPSINRLAKASLPFILNPPEGFADAPLSHPLGLMFVATREQEQDLYKLLDWVKQVSPHIHEISVEEALKKVPILNAEKLSAAIYDEQTISLDVHALHQGYIRGMTQRGGDLICNAGVSGLERTNGRWVVETPAGIFSAPIIVNASGAWADVVADMAGTRTIDIRPLRRTCIAFPAPDGIDPKGWPCVMDTNDDWYFKPDAGAFVGSLADETPDTPRDVQPEELDVAMAVDRIETNTSLSIRKLTQKWAGLRSFVKDKELVIGYAPDVEGFFWCAGQGGYGIGSAPAYSRAAAALIMGRELPEDLTELGLKAEHLAPERLWD